MSQLKLTTMVKDLLGNVQDTEMSIRQSIETKGYKPTRKLNLQQAQSKENTLRMNPGGFVVAVLLETYKSESKFRAKLSVNN
jgi:beta-galactosidase beta subunit